MLTTYLCYNCISIYWYKNRILWILSLLGVMLPSSEAEFCTISCRYTQCCSDWAHSKKAQVKGKLYMENEVT